MSWRSPTREDPAVVGLRFETDRPEAGAARSLPPWRENRATRGWDVGRQLGELWPYRELALVLARRELTARYRQTAFGVAWAVIQPVAAALLFTAVFGRLADVPSDGLPYLVFVFAGLVAWTYFSATVSEASQLYVDNPELITKIYFPRLLAPLAALLPPLLDLGISLVILAAIMVAFGVAPGLALLTILVWLVLLVASAFATGLFLCALNIRYRDVRHALQYLLQLWLFATPVVFPSSLAEGWWSYVLALNPLAGIIDGLRWSLIDGPAPGPELAVSVATLVVLLLAALAYFRRAERLFADVI